MAEDEKRLSKRQLEIELGKLRTLESPRLRLEQYPVSPEVAAELLYMAGSEHNDVRGKHIADLGTGTGRLAIGAALMGAKSVRGIDVDETALALARENAASLGITLDWTNGAVEDMEGKYDTVVMNPPFGTRSKHYDTKFLQRAFQLAPVAYSIHKSSTRNFLVGFVNRHGGSVNEVRSMSMTIPRLFSFHKRKWGKVAVDVYRITA